MLEIIELNLERGGQKLFQNLSFQLQPGQVLQIKGANGSGKSTLLQVIAGDLSTASGQVLINGKSKLEPRELPRELGYLPQEVNIDFPIEVSDFLLMARPNSDVSIELSRFKLDSLSHKKVTEISLGQLQRVQLAQLIIQDPQIFLLDEPFSAQDQENINLFISIFKDLKSDGKSIILTNHADFPMHNLVDFEINL